MNTQNPFPGMNPFMEQTWPDVHLSLIGYIRDLLGEELPDDLQAKAEQRVDVVGGDGQFYRPDVVVLEDPWKQGLPPVWTPDASGVTVTEPTLLLAEQEPERWVEIRTDQGKLVTVIEVLSPANKSSLRESYLAKRRDFLHSGVNVVEIDLLRQGALTVNVGGTNYERRFAGVGDHYVTCVTRAALPQRREVYVTPLRESLPVIRIPLRQTDPDVPLDIQSLINRCYATGRYWKLDHALVRLDPPLSGDDAEWAAACAARKPGTA